jgi:hypothetical protein
MVTGTMADTVHVIRGASAAGSLKVAGAKEMICFDDPLCPSPCDVNPARHLKKRRSFFRSFADGYEGLEADLYNAYLPWMAGKILGANEFVTQVSGCDRPVVLWTTPTFLDRLALWWALDAIQSSSLGSENFSVAEPALPKGHKAGPHLTVGCFAPVEFTAGFANRRPLKASVVRAGASLWQNFAAASPLRFDRARQTKSSSFPELKRVGEVYGRFFPQFSRGRLQLSKADQSLLETFGVAKWVRPVDVVKKNVDVDFFRFLGDFALLLRLHEWAATPALLMRRESDGTTYYNCVSYQLTALGQKLRKRGLDVPSEAPCMFLGGCRLYDTRQTWVRRNKGKEWWIERLT